MAHRLSSVAEREARDASPVSTTGSCLACTAGRLVEFLDLGRTALANNFVSKERLGAPDLLCPLRLGFCERCAMVQLLDVAPPPAMFNTYLYISSVSETLKRHLGELAEALCGRLALSAGSLVVDVGCNDGTLLAAFAARGMRTLGVDPAANVAPLAAHRGVTTVTAFFSQAVARRIRETLGPAMLVTATNVYQHVPDQEEFLRGLELLLAERGTFVFESHYLQDLLDQCAFDTVYHEHVFYFALLPLTRMLGRLGFKIVDVERLPVHHGQLRVMVARRSDPRPASPRVEALLAEERARGLDTIESYRRFAEAVAKCRSQLRALIEELRGRGARLAGYGAPAKGNTLLSFCGLGVEQLPYIVDLSPLKQGLYTPGTRIPVVPIERLRHDPPDYLLVLAWNFAEEIMAQLSWFRRAGGRFILPVPVPTVVE